jgi:hypothetical protein
MTSTVRRVLLPDLDIDADTDDTAMLRDRLAAAGPADDVVLTRVEQDAYRRTVDRLNAMWALSDPLARFIYDGGR